MRNKLWPNSPLWLGILGATALIFPFAANDYWVTVANFFGIYSLLGLSLNIIVGYAGLFNLGRSS
ncbi:MAG: hypothetical protein M1553_09655 [Firmicutes bacterium]|nr:hypothetical protein [Bacillota bacterium]